MKQFLRVSGYNPRFVIPDRKHPPLDRTAQPPPSFLATSDGQLPHPRRPDFPRTITSTYYVASAWSRFCNGVGA